MLVIRTITFGSEFLLEYGCNFCDPSHLYSVRQQVLDAGPKKTSYFCETGIYGTSTGHKFEKCEQLWSGIPPDSKLPWAKTAVVNVQKFNLELYPDLQAFNIAIRFEVSFEEAITFTESANLEDAVSAVTSATHSSVHLHPMSIAISVLSALTLGTSTSVPVSHNVDRAELQHTMGIEQSYSRVADTSNMAGVLSRLSASWHAPQYSPVGGLLKRA
ncbi:hypothetical protein OF83DRAFT_1089414 [Amylostereum chailletii]|nr:hypothetical protein OF83DRAFT_1089414 [Amylostereum chailletii]